MNASISLMDAPKSYMNAVLSRRIPVLCRKDWHANYVTAPMRHARGRFYSLGASVARASDDSDAASWVLASTTDPASGTGTVASTTGDPAEPASVVDRQVIAGHSYAR
jgi:hypothetical protein